MEFLLNQQWTDPRLQYGNKSQYDFLNALHHHDSIWTPDTYFIMHGDFKDPIIPMHFALRIFRNGTITYAMRCVCLSHHILNMNNSVPYVYVLCDLSHNLKEKVQYKEWALQMQMLQSSYSLDEFLGGVVKFLLFFLFGMGSVKY